MMIERVAPQFNPTLSAAPANNMNRSNVGGTDVGKRFGQFLNEALDNLKGQEERVHELGKQFLTGGLVDVHQVQIEAQKALLGLELTVEVRNKVIEAYQEIMRIQL